MDEPLHEQVGGAQALRAVLQDFYDRVFRDVMIGFFFRGRDKQRLVDKELELTLEALGAKVEYTGRPIAAVHAPFPILGGHFERRLQILRDTLADHDVPAAVRDAWIRHTESLRPLVTADAGSECDHDRANARRSSSR